MTLHDNPGYEQESYHDALFHGLTDWANARRHIEDMTGERDSVGGLIGLDQLGHFGPNGCELVAGALVEHLGDLRGPLLIAELGSGLGGALRDIHGRIVNFDVEVGVMVGVELVPAHAAVGAHIDQDLDDVTHCAYIAGSVSNLPLRSGALDAVVCTGSAPHFQNMGAVLLEVERVLRPGGMLVMTEEVSLWAGSVPVADAFRELHPPGVFFMATEAERAAQRRNAGLDDVEVRDIGDWAVALLRDRLKALRIFRGSIERIFGAPESTRIAMTLEVAREELMAGRLLARLVVARKPR